MEIERKYLVRYLPDNLESCTAKEIEQGYLNRKPTLRIRRSNSDYILTYKNKLSGNGKDSTIVNEEIEAALTKEAFEHLREKTDGYMISKTRYIVPLENGLKAELDIFHGRLEGLCFVEVEFPDVETADGFSAPDWFGENVSADKHYSNGYLSEINSFEEFKKTLQYDD